MINNVVLVSGVQQSDSVIHIHVPILFQIIFPFRLLYNIEQSSLCYTVGPCWLSILLFSSLSRNQVHCIKNPVIVASQASFMLLQRTILNMVTEVSGGEMDPQKWGSQGCQPASQILECEEEEDRGRGGGQGRRWPRKGALNSFCSTV